MFRLVGVVVLVSCAAPEVRATESERTPAPENREPFAALREKHVQVQLVDRGRLFADSPGVVSATKEAVEQQLARAGAIIVQGDSPELRRIVLTVDAPPDSDAYRAGACVQVTGTLETNSKAFLPAQQSIETRCGGKGPGPGTPNDLFAAIVSAAGTAVRPAGAHEKELAAALSHAVADVLSTLGMRTR
jgi:hypothetical protein